MPLECFVYSICFLRELDFACQSARELGYDTERGVEQESAFILDCLKKSFEIFGGEQ